MWCSVGGVMCEVCVGGMMCGVQCRRRNVWGAV